MTLVNALEKEPVLSRGTYETFLKLLAPFAPHVTEELWRNLGNKSSIHTASWPVADATKMQDSEVTIVVQINGKVRADFKAAKGAAKEDIEKQARALDEVKRWIGTGEIAKVIVVPDKLVSIVVKG
jgi:leucyl-tRNA synthetase